MMTKKKAIMAKVRMPLTHQFFHLEDKLERARLRTSGVSSAEVDMGAASARLSLSDAVSPSTFISDSDSCESSFVRKGRKAKDSYLQMKKQEL